MRSNHKVRDKFALDGVIACGERRVRKGGVLFFGGYRVQDEKLLSWVGRVVFVHVHDYWFTDVDISDAEHDMNFICKSKIENKPKKQPK